MSFTVEISPVILVSLITAAVQHLIDIQAQNVADMVQNKVKASLGKDVSIGDVALLNVGMIGLVEPYANNSVLSDNLEQRAKHTLIFLRSAKQLKKDLSAKEMSARTQRYQDDLNEMIGIYIALCESDRTIVESLLKTPRCILTSEDHYLAGIDNPCKQIAKESFVKVLKRSEDVQELEELVKGELKVPDNWKSSLKGIVDKLDSFIEILDSKSIPSWTRLREYVVAAAEVTS